MSVIERTDSAGDREANPSCGCTGIRFCVACRFSERARLFQESQNSLTKVSDVALQQYGAERTSSCSFAVVGASTLCLCVECGKVFSRQIRSPADAIRCCQDHDGQPSHQFPDSVSGLFVQLEFLSMEAEEELVAFLDNPHEPFQPWKASQSGRRKQDFGPKPNFKKKKLKVSEDFVGMPKPFQSLYEKISEYCNEVTARPMTIVQAAALEYTSENESSIDPHIDDTWLWGERVVGVNLAADSVMTFVSPEGTCVDAYFPRRAAFVLSGEARLQWMHGIRVEHIVNRRLSITMRELEPSNDMSSDMRDSILALAGTYI